MKSNALVVLKNASLNAAAVIFFSPISALANTEFTPNHEVSLGAALFQVGLALVFIIALILGSAWFARRFKFAGIGNEKQIKALSVMPLGRKEKVVLIESCGKKLLIGVASNSINTLHVFETEQRSSDADSAGEANVSHDCEMENYNLQAKSTTSVVPSANSVKTTREFSQFLKAVLSGNRHENGNEK